MKIPFVDGSEDSMIRFSRFATGAIGVGLVLVLIVAVAVPRRAAPRQVRARTASPPVARAEVLTLETPERLPFASPSKDIERKGLADAAVVNLVSNVVFASARGDEPTRRALVTRLARHKDRACDLLSSELSKARNEKTVAGLRAAIDELKENGR